MRNAVIITGMHRSGTSLLASLIASLGYSLGGSLIPPNKYNPKGYFENAKILEVNNQALKSVGASWDNLKGIDLLFSDLALQDRFIAAIRDVISKEFLDFPKFLIKDPRLMVLLPLYKRALELDGVSFKILRAIRNPLEVAASLRDRNSIQLDDALRLIAEYVTRFSLDNSNSSIKTVFYSELLRAPEMVYQEIQMFLGEESTPLGKLSEGLIAPELRHYSDDNCQLSLQLSEKLQLDREKISRLEELVTGLNEVIEVLNRKLSDQEIVKRA